MGSKVIGFRVPDDLAGELERISGERGMTTAEFLRKLVDDAIYPSNREQTAAPADTSLGEQISRLEDTQSWITDEFGNLSKQIDKLAEKIGQLETKNVLSPEQIAMINASANLANRVKDLEQRHDKLDLVLNENTNQIRGAILMAQNYGDSADNHFGKLQSEINILRSKLETLNSIPSKIEAVKSDVVRLSDRLSKVEREAKRIPTGETERLQLTDGRDHTFRVFKSPNGLAKPRRISHDLILGGKYIDLTEPLD